MIISCKEDLACEGWPDGFKCYEIIDGDKKEYCTVPLLKGWDLVSRSNAAEYALELTIQQGYHHIYLSGEEKGFFKAGTQYNLNAQNSGNYYPNTFGIAVDQQWFNSSSGLYWYASEGSLEITEADSINKSLSLRAEYTLVSGSDSGESRSYEVEITDYSFIFNPK